MTTKNGVIKEIGNHSNIFGRGDLIGEPIELVHLLPVSAQRKTKLNNDHAIVLLPDEDETCIITDVNLEITPV